MFGPKSSVMNDMGAKNDRLIQEQGEWWRVFACNWLHAGLIHLFMNMLAIVNLGFGLEKMFGFWKVRAAPPTAQRAPRAHRTALCQARRPAHCLARAVCPPRHDLQSLTATPSALLPYNSLTQVGLLYVLSGLFGTMVSMVFLPDILSVTAPPPPLEAAPPTGHHMSSTCRGCTTHHPPPTTHHTPTTPPPHPPWERPARASLTTTHWKRLLAHPLPGPMRQVGASASVFGLVGACWADVIVNFCARCTLANSGFCTLLIATIINVLIGLTPYVDNFMHLGGMIAGLLMGMVLFSQKHEDSSGQRRYTKMQIAIALAAGVAVVALAIMAIITGTSRATQVP